jgi:hypothetical protein
LVEKEATSPAIETSAAVTERAELEAKEGTILWAIEAVSSEVTIVQVVARGMPRLGTGRAKREAV